MSMLSLACESKEVLIAKMAGEKRPDFAHDARGASCLFTHPPSSARLAPNTGVTTLLAKAEGSLSWLADRAPCFPGA